MPVKKTALSRPIDCHSPALYCIKLYTLFVGNIGVIIHTFHHYPSPTKRPLHKVKSTLRAALQKNDECLYTCFMK